MRLSAPVAHARLVELATFPETRRLLGEMSVAPVSAGRHRPAALFQDRQDELECKGDRRIFHCACNDRHATYVDCIECAVPEWIARFDKAVEANGMIAIRLRRPGRIARALTLLPAAAVTHDAPDAVARNGATRFHSQPWGPQPHGSAYSARTRTRWTTPTTREASPCRAFSPASAADPHAQSDAHPGRAHAPSLAHHSVPCWLPSLSPRLSPVSGRRV